VVSGDDDPQVALRGSPTRTSDFKEQVQDAYLTAVAASAGCIVLQPRVDAGIDFELTHHSESHHATDHVARLEVQNKARSASMSADGFYVSATLSRARYDYFRTVDPGVDKIVMILDIPPEPDQWVELTGSGLLIRNGAYWVNIAGWPPSSANEPTVKAPTSNRFDDIALCAIMERIGKGGHP
jgi:hypothetical protein